MPDQNATILPQKAVWICLGFVRVQPAEYFGLFYYPTLALAHIPATIVKINNDDARLWEIAENLHRSELTKLERDENIAEWIKITERVSRQVVAKPQGGRPEGGIAAAARELGVHEKEAERAVKVASLSDEAKEAARETGLDNNRSALLGAASMSPLPFPAFV